MRHVIAQVFFALLFTGILLPSARSQTVTIMEVNPDRSTLDATNPNGASGGRVNGLAATPGDNQIFYAASEWGGLFKSVDGGQIWSHLPGHVPMVTWDVAVDPTNSSRIYATSFYDGRVGSLSGISVSLDAGSTWAHPPTANPPAAFCADELQRTEPGAFGIAIDPDNVAHVYIGTRCGLAISEDSGATWTYEDPTPADGADDVWDVVVHNGGIIDVCGDDGHMRRDGTGTWITATTQPLPSGRCSLAVSPDEADVLFAVVGTSIFETDNGGASWPVTYGNPSPQGRIPFLVVNDRTGSAFDVWFADTKLHRASCSTPAGGGAGARCPASGSWTDSIGQAHFDGGDLAFDSEATANACPRLFSSDGGVYINTATASPSCHIPTWEQPTRTPHALYVLDLDGADQPGATAEDLYFGNQDNGSFGATDGGVTPPTWSNVDCCDTFDVAASSTTVVNTRCCFSAGRFNRLAVRNPGLTGGTTLSEANHPPGNVRAFRGLDMIESFGPDDFVVVTSTGVFITEDISATNITWTQLGATSTPADACGIQVALTGGVPSFFIKSGGCNGNRPGNLFQFSGTDPSGSWTQITRPGAGGWGVYAVDPRDPLHIIASDLSGPSGPEMVRTTDGGTLWQVPAELNELMTGGGVFQFENQTGPNVMPGSAGIVLTGYPQPTLLAIDPQDSDVIVAGGADSGVFLSIDGAVSWSLVTDPFSPGTYGTPHVPRPLYAYFDHESSTHQIAIYIGSRGRGVWRLTVAKPDCGGDLCVRNPLLCGTIDFDDGMVMVECLLRECRIFDPIPKNCLVKWDCPGCRPGAMCPPWFHILVEDVVDVWEVDLIDRYGKGVPHELVRIGEDIVLSFRPAKDAYIDGQIGDYILTFELGPKGRPGQTYKLRTSVKASDGPFKSSDARAVKRH